MVLTIERETVMFRPMWTSLLALLIATSAAGAEDTRSRDQRFLDERARTVESSLQDLGNRNEKGLGLVRNTPRPAQHAFDGDRADLVGEDVPSEQALVRTEVASSLHRLRREAVSRQTPDNRGARVEDSRDRRVPEMLDRSGDQPARSSPEIQAPAESASATGAGQRGQ